MQERRTGEGTNGGQLRFSWGVGQGRFTQIDVRVDFNGHSGNWSANRPIVLPVWETHFVPGLDIKPDSKGSVAISGGEIS